MRLLRPLRWLLLVLAVALIPTASRAEVVISVGFAPPPLLVYDQPPCPDQGMIWTPGYWAYGPDGYYWVPGAWVPAPFVGALWTPGYWGWSSNMYYWHPGYWGPHVGYYGGVNYGFGYFGIGFLGGRWNGGFFEYNTAVWRVNREYIHRTYEDRDWNHNYVDRNSRVAFSGGPGGIRHDPDAQERAYMHEQHYQRTSFQTQHIDAAMRDHNAYYNVNHGRPTNVVASRPLGRETRPEPNQRNSFNNNRQPSRPQSGARNAYEHNNTNNQNRINEGNRNQEVRPQQRTQPEIRQQPQQRAQPEMRQQPQQRTQPEYRQQPQQRAQPEMRQQPQRQEQRAQPERRAAPQQRNESRGHSESAPQHDDHGHGK
jgi:WXXGXW repeat (2 copies)